MIAVLTALGFSKFHASDGGCWRNSRFGILYSKKGKLRSYGFHPACAWIIMVATEIMYRWLMIDCDPQVQQFWNDMSLAYHISINVQWQIVAEKNSQLTKHWGIFAILFEWCRYVSWKKSRDAFFWYLGAFIVLSNSMFANHIDKIL